MAQYSRGMEPVEQRIAGKLRHKLSKLDAHPQQVSYVLTYVCVPRLPTYIRTHIITYVGCMSHIRSYVTVYVCPSVNDVRISV